MINVFVAMHSIPDIKVYDMRIPIQTLLEIEHILSSNDAKEENDCLIRKN